MQARPLRGMRFAVRCWHANRRRTGTHVRLGTKRRQVTRANPRENENARSGRRDQDRNRRARWPSPVVGLSGKPTRTCCRRRGRSRGGWSNWRHQSHSSISKQPVLSVTAQLDKLYPAKRSGRGIMCPPRREIHERRRIGSVSSAVACVLTGSLACPAHGESMCASMRC